jgi:small-conductance mechanosensitive channel
VRDFSFEELTKENARSKDGSTMQALRSLALGLARAAIWPLYLVLLAYASRVAPWPRSLGILVSAVLTGAAIAIFIHELLRLLTRPSGWSERNLDVPAAVARQLGWDGRFVVMAALVFLLPVYLLNHELIAPEGKSITAPALCRLLVLGFELFVWGACVRLVRGGSPLLGWLSIPLSPAPLSETQNAVATAPAVPTTPLTDHQGHLTASARFYAALFWLGRRRRAVAGLVITAIAAIVVLDVRGYSFTARRVAAGGIQTAVAIALAVAAYRVLLQVISRNAWRWTLPNRSWAMALTSAMALRSKARSRTATAEPIVEPSVAQPDLADDADDTQLADLTSGLRHLSAYALTALTVLTIAWIWEVDMALVQFLLNHQVWGADTPTPVTVGDVAEATIVILLGALSWRYMSTLFAITLFPRMTDDPGVRFAVVTLCRYTVLGIASLVALAAIHLDLAKIGVVLAALGVGLGFGLQEIVSNFVCGIILLLERPIRIGDVVTVAGTTGKVDRINIRATTIINADNQSMVVPNREFITGNLVNWTLKDKILRVPIKVSVAYGTDPERVVNLLLGIARADSDVMINPPPSAALEGFGESSLLFALYTFVPEPGLAGGVRHRLCSEIQRRFTADGIVIPYPTHELHLNRVPEGLTRALETARADATPPHRFDQPSRTPPTPHSLVAATLHSPDQEDNEVARRGE